tara:strand:+ start:1175 stop:1324 length:150 start_codon:yes stop_codon:yes gene_type:complete
LESFEKSAEAGGLPGLFLFKTVLLVFPLLFGIQFISLALKSIYYLFYEK